MPGPASRTRSRTFLLGRSVDELSPSRARGPLPRHQSRKRKGLFSGGSGEDGKLRQGSPRGTRAVGGPEPETPWCRGPRCTLWTWRGPESAAGGPRRGWGGKSNQGRRPQSPSQPVGGGGQAGGGRGGSLGHWDPSSGRRPWAARGRPAPGAAGTQARREQAGVSRPQDSCSPPFWGPLPRPHPPCRLQSWAGGRPQAHRVSTAPAAGPAQGPPTARCSRAWDPARPSPSSLSLLLTFCILVSFPVGFAFPSPALPVCDTLSLLFSLFCLLWCRTPASGRAAPPPPPPALQPPGRRWTV